MNLSEKHSIKKVLEKRLIDGTLRDIKIRGSSMLPLFSSGDCVHIKKADISKLKIGDIVVATHSNINYLVVHRIIKIDEERKFFYLRGDNQDMSEMERFNYTEIYGIVKPISKYKTNKKFSIVIDLPFEKPFSFNTKSFEIYQMLCKDKNDAIYLDYNIEFNREIYKEEEINNYNNNEIDDVTAEKFFKYMKRRREICKRVYNLHFFSYSNLSLCDYKDESEIKDIITNYKKTIFYNFYNKKLSQLAGYFLSSKSKANVYISVDNFEKLISAVIFSLVLQDKFKVKPILIDNSTLFDGNYHTTVWNKYFSKIMSMSKLYSTTKNYNCSYDAIDFKKYIPNNNVATIRFMKECYYKKCLFCDRHSKENFCYTVDMLYNKIVNLKKHGIENFVFVDDSIPIGQIKTLLKKLSDENIKIKWKGNFRFEKVLNNEKTISFFSQMGCKMIFFGIETFDDQYRNYLRKGVETKDIIDILKLCKKYNIETSTSFLFNFPGETIDSLKITSKVLQENIDLISHLEFNYFVPTKNCKLKIEDDKLNYFCIIDKITKEQNDIINEILAFAKEKNKKSAYYLKNFKIWN